MHCALAESQWSDVERLLREEWKLRRTNAPGDHHSADRPAD